MAFISCLAMAFGVLMISEIGSHDPVVENPITWPFGTYGLPKPVFGCPNGWAVGSRYHDTEDRNSNNQWDATNHFSAYLNRNNLRQEFCMKTDETADLNHWSWPEGRYCIFKKGYSCPEGLSEGYLFWDDEDRNNRNAVDGEIPKGIYNHDTKIYYCCATTGYASNPIYLPVEKPFYLMKNNHQCQRVHGMVYNEEWIHWDNEDRSANSQQGGEHPYIGVYGNRDINIEYCYYTRIGRW